jgi:hypothetical protein
MVILRATSILKRQKKDKKMMCNITHVRVPVVGVKEQTLMDDRLLFFLKNKKKRYFEKKINIQAKKLTEG